MAHSGSYWLLAAVVAILDVGAAAAHDFVSTNDHFSQAIPLIGLTNDVIGNNTNATADPYEPNHAGAVGGKSLWWSWQAPITGTFYFSTSGSAFDTLLAIYTGDLITELELVAQNDDADGFGVVSSYAVFRALAGETYRIAVDGFMGASGPIRLTMGRVGQPAPFWSIVDLHANTLNATDFPPRVLVIDFWETTCSACVEEVPHLVQIHQDFGPEGLVLFGVAKDVNVNDVQRYVQSHSVPYAVAMRTEEIEDSFGGNVALPTKFIIDREGMLVRTFIGGGDYATYENLLKPLLRGSRRVPLSVRRRGQDFVFAWPAEEFGYRLESTATLGGTNWTAVSSSVVMTNAQNTITIPAATSAQFFRLRKTPVP